MRASSMLLFGLLATTLAIASSCSADVSVTGGVVRGAQKLDGSTVFLGIPYAAPPVGALRWRAPAPVVPWQGVRDATAAPAPCLQHNEGWNKKDAAKSREDCLYLSIHSPKHSSSDRLPVLFWIHGGSNMAGSGFGYADSKIHRQGIVLVSIEYRLGVFGFLASPALSAESATHTSGNVAVLDQIAALQWVHDNIARFGGDADNITIAGQSAGAYDVNVLIASPRARGLFHKAISQSAWLIQYESARNQAQSEAIGERFAALAGAPEGAERLAALRAISGDALLAAADKLKPDNTLPLWGQAAIDGDVLPRPLRDIFQSGEQAHVPLLIGNNAREFGFAGSADDMRAFITNGFAATSAELLAAYGLNKPGEPGADPILGSVGMRLMSDLVFRCPAIQIADLHFKTGQRVWYYQFGVGPPGRDKPVEHSSELKYVFNALPPIPDFTLWPPVQTYWANFARTGDPNGPGVPAWPDRGKEANYIDFTPEGPKPRQDLRGDLCRLINRPG
jgi:para-nitrobenzyl esterase